MFVFKKDLSENPGAALKDFAKKMLIVVEILTVLCIVLAGAVGVLITRVQGLGEAVGIIVVGGILLAMQQIFMISTYGVLYGIGVLIESNQQKVQILEHKNEYDARSKENSRQMGEPEDELPRL